MDNDDHNFAHSVSAFSHSQQAQLFCSLRVDFLTNRIRRTLFFGDLWNNYTQHITAICSFSDGQLTIIERGWAKYRDLSVESRSIICRSRRRRQITDLRDTDKSRYFAITEFNNCFIIRSPFFWSTKYVKSLCLLGGVVSITHAQNICWKQNTYLKEVIFSSRGELSANEKEGKNTSNDNYFFCRESLCFAQYFVCLFLFPFPQFIQFAENKSFLTEAFPFSVHHSVTFHLLPCLRNASNFDDKWQQIVSWNLWQPDKKKRYHNPICNSAKSSSIQQNCRLLNHACRLLL